jgi:hypothetical protein
MNDDQIITTAVELRETYHPEDRSPEWVFVIAILDWQSKKATELNDAELNSEEFRHYVGERVRRVREADMFSGRRPFSFEKLAAMMSYAVSRGHDISRTKLNKLLFYADFVNYFLHGQSISGSRYIHNPYGPVPEYYREALEVMSADNRLQTERTRGHDELISSGPEVLDVLTILEIASLGWVLENFDSLTAHALSDLSHEEKAFRFTKLGEFIPYEFARYFRRLPELPAPTDPKPINGH